MQGSSAPPLDSWLDQHGVVLKSDNRKNHKGHHVKGQRERQRIPRQPGAGFVTCTSNFHRSTMVGGKNPVPGGRFALGVVNLKLPRPRLCGKKNLQRKEKRPAHEKCFRRTRQIRKRPARPRVLRALCLEPWENMFDQKLAVAGGRDESRAPRRGKGSRADGLWQKRFGPSKSRRSQGAGSNHGGDRYGAPDQSVKDQGEAKRRGGPAGFGQGGARRGDVAPRLAPVGWAGTRAEPYLGGEKRGSPLEKKGAPPPPQ